LMIIVLNTPRVCTAVSVSPLDQMVKIPINVYARLAGSAMTALSL